MKVFPSNLNFRVYRFFSVLLKFMASFKTSDYWRILQYSTPTIIHSHTILISMILELLEKYSSWITVQTELISKILSYSNKNIHTLLINLDDSWTPQSTPRDENFYSNWINISGLFSISVKIFEKRKTTTCSGCCSRSPWSNIRNFPFSSRYSFVFPRY